MTELDEVDALPSRWRLRTMADAEDIVRSVKNVMQEVKQEILAQLQATIRKELSQNLQELKVRFKAVAEASEQRKFDSREYPKKEDGIVVHMDSEQTCVDVDSGENLPMTEFGKQLSEQPLVTTTNSFDFGAELMEETLLAEIRNCIRHSKGELEGGQERGRWSATREVAKPFSGEHKSRIRLSRTWRWSGTKKGSFTGSCDANDSENDSEKILKTIIHGDFDEISALMRTRNLEPNTVFRDVSIHDTSFTQCSLLASAVMSGQEEIVRWFVRLQADPNSKCGFRAGVTQLDWSGPVAVLTCVDGNLAMLKCLIAVRADPHLLASNGTNLVWQCAYYGQDEMLDYLLGLGVSYDIEGLSPNKTDVRYSPLHTSVLMGNGNCASLLLEANAPVNTRNEDFESPLDTAIKQSSPSLVTLLIREGAALLEAQDKKTVKTQHNIDSPKTSETSLQDDRGRGMAILFHSTKINPVVVEAAALGLQRQPVQVANLSLPQVLRFWETSATAMILTLNALFKVRHIQTKSGEKGVRQKRTAVLGKGEINVVESIVSYADIEDLFQKGKAPTGDVKAFIKRLVPKYDNQTWCSSLSDRAYTSVDVYECIVPCLQDDLRFLKAIAQARPLDDVYDNSHCQALISYAWMTIRKYAAFECFAHSVLLVIFVLLALENEKYDSEFWRWELERAVPMLAVIGIPFWLYGATTEMAQFAAFVRHGWATEYILDIGNIVDYSRIALDLFLLFPFVVWGKSAADEFYVRFIFAIGCFLKWTKWLYTLTPFRQCGLPLMPILFTIRDIGPFVVIMLVYFAGMAHAMIALGRMNEHPSFTTVRAFSFGLLGELEQVEPFARPEESLGYWERLCIEVLLTLATFAAPITLMNIFIAALSNSYSIGVTHMEKLYQSRKAEAAFSLSAIRQLAKSCSKTTKGAFIQAGPNKRRLVPENTRLWYCIKCDQKHELEQ